MAAEPPASGQASGTASVPPDPDAYDSPRAVQARARGLAAPYIAGGEDPDLAATHRRERRYLRLLVAMIVVVVLAGFVLGIAANLLGLSGLLGGAAPGATQGPLAQAAFTPASPSPAPTDAPQTTSPSAPPTLGPFEDGVPTTLDGVPVVHGEAVLAVAASSTDATTFLLGGWFHAAPNVRFCALFRPPRPVDACGRPIDLFVASNTKLGVTLAAGTVGQAAMDLAATTIRPVVLRVHTHDPLCVGEFKSCRSTLVLDEVAWLGWTLAAVPPAPVEQPPASSFSRHDALAKARHRLGSAYELKSIKVVRDTTAEGIQLGPVSDDPWVWWLKYRIPGTGSTAVFVYDYVTGKELLRSYGIHL